MTDVFVLANMVLLIAIFPLFQRVIKNRNNLTDIDLRGATLTTLGLTLFAGGYWQLDMFYSLVLLIPTLCYWAFISYCGAKSYIIKRNALSLPAPAAAT